MELCFAADRTLGKLAKWLRILGFDTLYEPDLPAGCFSELEPDRVLLTRRATLRQIRTENPYIIIRSDRYWDQLVEVVKAAGITPESIRPFSRCIPCNATILPADKAELQGKVPDYVRETHQVFRICPECQRIYWAGTHIERSMQKIRCLFNGTYNTVTADE